MATEAQRVAKREYNRAYRLAHRDELAALKREYRRTHRDQIREYERSYAQRESVRARARKHQRVFYAVNRERVKQSAREYYRANRERALAAAREYRRLHRHEIRERRRRYDEKYKRTHPEKLRELDRRHRKCRVGFHRIKAKVVETLWLFQAGRCFYCWSPLDAFEIDHKLPVSRGGTHEARNLSLACQWCNRSKGDRTAEEFLGTALTVETDV